MRKRYLFYLDANLNEQLITVTEDEFDKYSTSQVTLKYLLAIRGIEDPSEKLLEREYEAFGNCLKKSFRENKKREIILNIV